MAQSQTTSSFRCERDQTSSNMQQAFHERGAAHAAFVTRRWFLCDCGVGLAGIAAASLVAREVQAAASTVHRSHFAPKAKSIIYLFHAGAPSHLELFDSKPVLARHDGRLPPAALLQGYRTAFINPN